MALLDLAPTVAVGVLLIVAGLVLAFAGKTLVKALLAVIGAILGGILGLLGGTLLGGPGMELILAAVGAILGALVFGFVVRAAFSLAMGVLAAAVAFAFVGGEPAPGAGVELGTLAIALVALVIAALITFVLFNRLLIPITAAVGGWLVGIGLNYILVNTVSLATNLVALGSLALGIAVFIAGAISQGRRD